MDPNNPFDLTVVALEHTTLVKLRAKWDRKLRKSVISQAKADATGASGVVLPSRERLMDSEGVIYNPQCSMRLQCKLQDGHKVFLETFYIVDSCPFDAVLGKDIVQDPSSDEPGCFPLVLKTQKKEQRDEQDARVAKKAKDNNKKKEEEKEKELLRQEQQQQQQKW